MSLLLPSFLLLFFLGGGVIWWVISHIRNLLAELQRIASGDYRPVLLKGMSRFFGSAVKNLRIIAETLTRQQSLLAKEEFSLAMILERMTEGVVITGLDLRIRVANEAAMTMFSLHNATSGLLLQEAFRSHELQRIAQHAASTGDVQHGEFTIGLFGRSEHRHLMVTAASLRTSEKKTADGLLLVLHDITRLRELESVRREFVANVSHEFRTPLSIINGYLETIEQKGIGREMLQKSISVMRRHCDRLNRLIEDLLTISRMEEKTVRLETEPVNLEEILRNVIAQMEHKIEERWVRLQLQILNPLPLIEVDLYRMEQAFSNLLANALRHGRSEGGEITISIALQKEEFMISFRDNGPGIPFQDQEHIFERFYRVGGDRARHTGGTGLGLSIVKNVVQVHGGHLMLESKPGGGSTFIIFLPMKKPI